MKTLKYIILLLCINIDAYAVVFEYLTFSRSDSSESATYNFDFYEVHGGDVQYSGSFGLGIGDTSTTAMLYATGLAPESLEDAYIDLFLDGVKIDEIDLNGGVIDNGGGMYEIRTSYCHNIIEEISSPEQTETPTLSTVTGAQGEVKIVDITINRADNSVARNYQIEYRHTNGEIYRNNVAAQKGDSRVRFIVTTAIFNNRPPDESLMLSNLRLYVDGKMKYFHSPGPHIFVYNDNDRFDNDVIPDPINSPNNPPLIEFPDDPIDPFPDDGTEIPYNPPEYNPDNPDPVEPYVPPTTPESPIDSDPVTPDPNTDYDTDVPNTGLVGNNIYSWITQLQLQILALGNRINDITGGTGDDGSGTTNNASGGNVFIKGVDNQVYGNLFETQSAATELALQNRELSAAEIALKINDVLEARGIDSDTARVTVKAALKDQGLSDYKIGIAVSDALYNSGMWGADMPDYVESGLERQHLSAWQIAAEIKAALESIGLNADGMEDSLKAAFDQRDISGHNFQMAFEAALVNKGMNAQNMANASELALANRNLSSAQIGKEVGNQMRGLGLSTRENDDHNTDRIVGAIEGLSFSSNGFSSVVGSINQLNQVVSNIFLFDKEYVSNVVGAIVLDPDTPYDYDSTYTNVVTAHTDAMDAAEGAGNSFSSFLEDVFDFSPPDIPRTDVWVIDFSDSLGSFFQSSSSSYGVYQLDLTTLNPFRNLEVFALNLGCLFAMVKIFRTVLSS